MRPPSLLQLLAGTVLCLLVAVPSSAQTSSPKPRSGGLFGATQSDTGARDRLDVTGLVTAGIDSELPPGLVAELSQDALQSGGLSTMLYGSADYTHNRRRARVAVRAQTAFRYYERLNRLDALAHSAGVGGNFHITTNSSLLMEQSAAYSPSYLYQLFPSIHPPELGETIPTAPDYQLVESDSYSYRTNLSFSASPQRGTQVTVGGTYDRTDFRGELAQRVLQPKVDNYTARVNVGRGVRRNVRLSGEYEYRSGDFEAGVIIEHRASFSAEYSRALSASRRATFRGVITPSVINISDSASSPAGTDQVNRLQGEGSIDYQFRRSWLASATFRRGVDYVPVFAEAFLTSSGRASVEGLLTQRLDLLVTTAFAKGTQTFTGASGIDSSTSNIRVRYALARSFAIYSEYIYFSYDLTARQSSDPELPRTFSQNGFRIGGILWASVF